MKSLEKLAVDANPILSAIIGGSAGKVFMSAETISFYTTTVNFKEVEKYIPILSSKRGLLSENLYLALFTLPIIICAEDFYKDKINQAKALIETRDPDDIYLLALALKLGSPIWSNDKDFHDLEVEVYSTLDLIKFFSA